MQVAKWGNSLAIRLPAAVIEALELKAGDEIEIRIADARELSVARKPGRKELLKRLRAFRAAFAKISRSSRSTRFSRRNRLSSVRSSVVKPSLRRPSSRPACLSQ
jgi:antitoxin MazE